MEVLRCTNSYALYMINRLLSPTDFLYPSWIPDAFILPAEGKHWQRPRSHFECMWERESATKPNITFSKRPRCTQPLSDSAFTQRRGLCKSELDGGGKMGGAWMQIESRRRRGRCIKEVKRVSEDVLVIMATYLSGKCSRCAADMSFHHTHASSLSLPEEHGRVLAACAPFFFSFFPFCFFTPAVCLLENLFSCSLALYLPIFPPLCQPALPSCTLPSASSWIMSHAFSLRNWFFFLIFWH